MQENKSCFSYTFICLHSNQKSHRLWRCALNHFNKRRLRLKPCSFFPSRKGFCHSHHIPALFPGNSCAYLEKSNSENYKQPEKQLQNANVLNQSDQNWSLVDFFNFKHYEDIEGLRYHGAPGCATERLSSFSSLQECGKTEVTNLSGQFLQRPFYWTSHSFYVVQSHNRPLLKS